jgi:hypothetical protein
VALNGTCAGGQRCAANATCSDVVKTPSGEPGHRCACVPGMDGDGFSAGDGCYLKSPGELSCVSASKIFYVLPFCVTSLILVYIYLVYIKISKGAFGDQATDL